MSGQIEVLKKAFSDSLERELAKCVLEQKPERSDVILLWTGYGSKLSDGAAILLKNGLSDRIEIFGYNSYPWKENPTADAKCYAHYLESKHGIPWSRMGFDCEDDGSGTKSQAVKSAKMMKERGYEQALLVTAGYHHVRAFMTMVKALNDLSLLDLRVVPSPLRISDWNAKDKVLKNSWSDEFITNELPRLRSYQETGDICSWELLGSYLVKHRFAKVSKR